MGDLLMKNAAMLYKWWWTFANEEKPLWKKIVGSCHRTDVNSSSYVEIKKNSGPWGAIRNIGKMSNVVERIISCGL